LANAVVPASRSAAKGNTEISLRYGNCHSTAERPARDQLRSTATDINSANSLENWPPRRDRWASAASRLAHLKADTAAGKSGSVEIGGLPDTLADEYGLKAVESGLATHEQCLDLRRSTVWVRFFRYASHQHPVEWNLEAKYMRDGLAHVCIADWRFGNEARFEIRPDRCHEIHGIG